MLPSRWCRVAAACAMAVLLFSSCSRKKEEPERVRIGVAESSIWPLDDDGQWLMPAKDYASTRFSALGDINTGNVKNLKVAWTFSAGNVRGHEAAPLVVRGTMYVVTPFPNDLYALDLTLPGAPAKWVYHPKPLPAAQGVACCDVVHPGSDACSGRVLRARRGSAGAGDNRRR
jgi:glucose dehydrogenase